MKASFANVLSGGDRRSLGRAADALTALAAAPRRLPELIGCLWHDHPVVVMRAADVLEKWSRPPASARSLDRYASGLLGLIEETAQAELRWHLAQILPRLQLSTAQVDRVAAVFESWLDTQSGALVRVFALQGLCDLARAHPRHRLRAQTLVEEQMHSPSPAVRARACLLAPRLLAPKYTAGEEPLP